MIDALSKVYRKSAGDTVELFLKDPPKKGQCINNLNTRDILKSQNSLLYYIEIIDL